jgi:thiamine kinase-like enzyme
MDRAQVTRLCEICGLGIAITEPQAITGGLIHRLWRLTTTQGMFAVKQLHAAIMKKPGIRDAFRLSERISAMMAHQGIPAVVALADSQGEVLHTSGDQAYIVYPWIEGETLSMLSIGVEHARQMGAILAHIHALHLNVPEMGTLEWKHFNDDDWDILTYQAFDLNLPWAYPVRAAMPKLVEWTRAYEAVEHTFSQHLVISHTDLDSKNVIWRNAQTPEIIDWEAAGWIHPTMELVNVALSWSGISTGAIRDDIFQATFEGYLQAGGVLLDSSMNAIYGSMGTWLGWLLFNLRRSLGESVESDEEQQLGIREATNTLAILQTIATHAQDWATKIDALRG